VQTALEKLVLQLNGDGRLAGGGEAGQPNCEAFLFAELVALIARDAGVVGDVSINGGLD
jgi:hypothetical protein